MHKNTAPTCIKNVTLLLAMCTILFLGVGGGGCKEGPPADRDALWNIRDLGGLHWRKEGRVFCLLGSTKAGEVRAVAFAYIPPGSPEEARVVIKDLEAEYLPHVQVAVAGRGILVVELSEEQLARVREDGPLWAERDMEAFFDEVILPHVRQ